MKILILFLTFNPGLIDSRTLVITIVGYCLVFLALAILGFIFSQAHKASGLLATRPRKNDREEEPPAPGEEQPGDQPAYSERAAVPHVKQRRLPVEDQEGAERAEENHAHGLTLRRKRL